jgi:hypothetical protein
MVFGKLFGKRPPPPPPPPPPRSRRVLAHDVSLPRALAGLRSYEALTARVQPVTLAMVEVERWLVVDVPTDLHPYLFHNLATWIGDPHTPLVVLSDGDDPRWRYYLTRDPLYTDFLSGRQVEGTTLSIYLPDQRVARGEPLGDAFPPIDDFLRRLDVPAPLVASPLHTLGASTEVVLALDPIGWDAFNPGLETRLRRRSDLRIVM